MKFSEKYLFPLFLFAFLLIFILSATLYAQPQPKNYQEYLLLMRAMNDTAREHGAQPLQPLSRTDWERLLPKSTPNQNDSGNPAASKTERIKYARFMGGKASGPDATVLFLRQQITSELKQHYSKDADMILAWREMGFKKVIFSDGKRSWSRSL